MLKNVGILERAGLGGTSFAGFAAPSLPRGLTHNNPARTTHPQGHSVSSDGDAAGVPGCAGQGPVELHQPSAAPRGAAAERYAAGRSDAAATIAANRPLVAQDVGRQPLGPGFSA